MGYQGYFQEQGIDSNEHFRFAVKTGKVDAEALVQSAVDKGRLSNESLDDEAYLNDVQFQLHQQNRF